MAILPNAWWASFLVGDFQFHTDIDGVGSQSIQGLDFPETATVVQVCLGDLIQRIAPDDGVDAMGFLRFGGGSLFYHRVDGNTVIGKYAVSGVVISTLLCIGKETVSTNLATAAIRPVFTDTV